MAVCIAAFPQTTQPYILEHESDIAKTELGTHSGGGNTTGYSFFSKADGLKNDLRKRVLHPGSAIGYHLQNKDEVYLISGTGEMQMNRPDNSRGLKLTGNSDLTIIIAYQTP